MIHKCSEIEDQIRLIIKARRLWEEKHKEDTIKQFAERPQSVRTSNLFLQKARDNSNCLGLLFCVCCYTVISSSQ